MLLNQRGNRESRPALLARWAVPNRPRSLQTPDLNIRSTSGSPCRSGPRKLEPRPQFTRCSSKVGTRFWESRLPRSAVQCRSPRGLMKAGETHSSRRMLHDAVSLQESVARREERHLEFRSHFALKVSVTWKLPISLSPLRYRTTSSLTSYPDVFSRERVAGHDNCGERTKV
jgi:hypothetical protein